MEVVGKFRFACASITGTIFCLKRLKSRVWIRFPVNAAVQNIHLRKVVKNRLE